MKIEITQSLGAPDEILIEGTADETNLMKQVGAGEIPAEWAAEFLGLPADVIRWASRPVLTPDFSNFTLTPRSQS